MIAGGQGKRSQSKMSFVRAYCSNWNFFCQEIKLKIQYICRWKIHRPNCVLLDSLEWSVWGFPGLIHVTALLHQLNKCCLQSFFDANELLGTQSVLNCMSMFMIPLGSKSLIKERTLKNIVSTSLSRRACRSLYKMISFRFPHCGIQSLAQVSTMGLCRLQ